MVTSFRVLPGRLSRVAQLVIKESELGRWPFWFPYVGCSCDPVNQRREFAVYTGDGAVEERATAGTTFETVLQVNTAVLKSTE